MKKTCGSCHWGRRLLVNAGGDLTDRICWRFPPSGLTMMVESSRSACGEWKTKRKTKKKIKN